MAHDLAVLRNLSMNNTRLRNAIRRETLKQIVQMQKVAGFANEPLDSESEISRSAHFKARTIVLAENS